MRSIISDGSEDYFVASSDAMVNVYDVDEAVRYLSRFADEPMALNVMRDLLEEHGAPLTRGEDQEETLRAFADLLVSRRVRLVRFRSAIKVEPEVASEKPPAEQQASQPKSKPPPKEPQDAQNVDSQAQADTLQRAAEDGKPFCEECEKARQAQQQKQAAGAT